MTVIGEKIYLQWQWGVMCAPCTSGFTSATVTDAKTLWIYFTALPRFTVHPSQAGRSLLHCAVLQSLVLLVVSYEGKQPIRLKPLKGNAAPLQAAKTAKSSQNSVSNIDINTDVHTQTLPVPCTSTHTGTPLSFLSIMTFVLAKDCGDCLLLWSWPSW